jgi:hypothetical protein
MVPCSLVKFEWPPFWNCSYGIKSYGVEVIISDMTSILNFIKIYQLVQELMGAQTHRQDGDLISLFLALRRKVG